MMHHDAPICTMMHLHLVLLHKMSQQDPRRFTFQSSVRPCETKRQSFREAKRRIVDSEAQKSRCSPGTEEMQRILRISACDIFTYDSHMIHIWFRYNIFRLNIASREEFLSTSASVKSYQLVKVVSGGRAPGKSSSLASPQLLVIEQFHCFGAVRLEKVHFFYCVDFKKYIWSFIQGGAACLLLAAACCCLPVAAHLARRRRRQDGARRNRHNRRRRRSTDKTCHAFRPQWNEGFFPVRNSWVDRTTNFLRAVHDIDAHRASHRFGCGKQGAPISLYHPRS